MRSSGVANGCGNEASPPNERPEWQRRASGIAIGAAIRSYTPVSDDTTPLQHLTRRSPIRAGCNAAARTLALALAIVALDAGVRAEEPQQAEEYPPPAASEPVDEPAARAQSTCV